MIKGNSVRVAIFPRDWKFPLFGFFGCSPNRFIITIKIEGHNIRLVLGVSLLNSHDRHKMRHSHTAKRFLFVVASNRTAGTYGNCCRLMVVDTKWQTGSVQGRDWPTPLSLLHNMKVVCLWREYSIQRKSHSKQTWSNAIEILSMTGAHHQLSKIVASCWFNDCVYLWKKKIAYLS